ncbi:hypothetical protein AB0I35_31180 [Nocardia sp. NPDC050378]|uniref:hypothetical protein n=1 Tax=Nocardia sp. NPDC050378 TaxID=3155400 RepID=UPI00340BA85B
MTEASVRVIARTEEADAVFALELAAVDCCGPEPLPAVVEAAGAGRCHRAHRTLRATAARARRSRDGLRGPVLDGTTVAATPLTFRLDEFELPIVAEIAGNTATLSPQLDASRAVYKPVALPFEDKAPWKSEYEREVAAWTRLTTTISTGAAIGTLVGGIGGILAVGALGTLAGQIFITAPVAIGAAIQYFTTINQPFNAPAK